MVPPPIVIISGIIFLQNKSTIRNTSLSLQYISSYIPSQHKKNHVDHAAAAAGLRALSSLVLLKCLRWGSTVQKLYPLVFDDFKAMLLTEKLLQVTTCLVL